ncbi:UPF0481 protein At3g47200-like isoform X2 [Cornus florida]|uniref:UPF0481 protein At3g47200-like isoform X2 n=1 Tax=Cornus florida TaxID=4283 RepID=UPI0028A27023|nr:UPF0481 protein At3g47200-like isoform X2 [Cornus florida]
MMEHATEIELLTGRSFMAPATTNVAAADSGKRKDVDADGMADQGSSSEGTLLQLLESLDKKSQSSSNNIQTLADYGCKWVPLVHRIPDEIRKLNEGAYTPTVVSIGPLRRDEEHLQPMEKEIFCYMQCLFKRFENEGLEQPYMQVLVEHCARAMLEIEPSAHYWYSDSKIRPDNEVKAEVKFAEMMLIDGCFIIELLYRNRISTSMYSITDPILDNYFMRFAVQNDLIRLENQIPFEVL